MKRLVEYRNLTFESSSDGILQIWFEAQCDEEFLFARIYVHDRDTAFERITPQVLTGWALYRSSTPKGFMSGAYVSLRPHGSSGGAMGDIKVHLDKARKSEVYASFKQASGSVEVVFDQKAAQHFSEEMKDFRKRVRQEVFVSEKIAEMMQSGRSVDEILACIRESGGKNAE